MSPACLSFCFCLHIFSVSERLSIAELSCSLSSFTLSLLIPAPFHSFFCLLADSIRLYSVPVLPLPVCLSELWCLCCLNVFTAPVHTLGSTKLCGAKCSYSQWRDELCKSTVMYYLIRDFFGKEAASYCKDTTFCCMCVCVRCETAMKSQCQVVFCPSRLHWKKHRCCVCVLALPPR